MVLASFVNLIGYRLINRHWHVWIRQCFFLWWSLVWFRCWTRIVLLYALVLDAYLMEEGVPHSGLLFMDTSGPVTGFGNKYMSLNDYCNNGLTILPWTSSISDSHIELRKDSRCAPGLTTYLTCLVYDGPHWALWFRMIIGMWIW